MHLAALGDKNQDLQEDFVLISGLQSQSGLNGQCGTVLRWIPQTERYEIALQEGRSRKVVCVRPVCLEMLRATSTSDRHATLTTELSIHRNRRAAHLAGLT